MATNAERQAAYRERQKNIGMGVVHILIKPEAKNALEQLAEHYSITQSEMVERMIEKAYVQSPIPELTLKAWREKHGNMG